MLHVYPAVASVFDFFHIANCEADAIGVNCVAQLLSRAVTIDIIWMVNHHDLHISRARLYTKLYTFQANNY